jgi:hypothetical protein
MVAQTYLQEVAPQSEVVEPEVEQQLVQRVVEVVA